MVDSTAEIVVQTQEEAVRAKMLSLDEPKIEILKPEEVEGFSFDLPDREKLLQGLKKNFPNLSEADLSGMEEQANHFFNFLSTSLIKYPPTPEGIPVFKHINEVDEQILDNFNGEDREIAYKITLNNRLRVNLLTTDVENNLIFVITILDGNEASDKLSIVLSKIKGLASVESSYREGKSYEEKMEIAKKFSKAAEMTLKILNGDELADEEFDSL